MYNGIFEKTVPEFSGIHVFKADKPIIEKLEESNNLICVNDFCIATRIHGDQKHR